MEILGENVRTFSMTPNASVLCDVLVDPRFSCKTSRKVRGARHCCGRINRSRANSHASASSSSAKSDDVTKEMLKRELFDVFGIASSSSSSNDERNDDERNQRRQKQQRKKRVAKGLDKTKLQSVVARLEQTMVDENTIERTELLCGRWKLLCTYKEDVDVVEFFDVKSWQRYLFEKGPSPVQSLVLGNTSTVENVYQVLEDPKEAPNAKWQNVAKFTFEFNGERKDVELIIEADIEGVRDEQSFFYRFSNGYFDVNRGELKLPYPVPFDFIEKARPGQTKGWFQTTYLDEELRVSVGQKGSKFILMRERSD
jgi:hypothetical protein